MELSALRVIISWKLSKEGDSDSSSRGSSSWDTQTRTHTASCWAKPGEAPTCPLNDESRVGRSKALASHSTLGSYTHTLTLGEFIRPNWGHMTSTWSSIIITAESLITFLEKVICQAKSRVKVCRATWLSKGGGGRGCGSEVQWGVLLGRDSLTIPCCCSKQSCLQESVELLEQFRQGALPAGVTDAQVQISLLAL